MNFKNVLLFCLFTLGLLSSQRLFAAAPTISMSNITASGSTNVGCGTAITMSVTLTTGNGVNTAPAVGQTVTWVISLATGDPSTYLGTFSSTSTTTASTVTTTAVTNASGVATVVYTTSSTSGAKVNVTASVGAVSKAANITNGSCAAVNGCNANAVCKTGVVFALDANGTVAVNFADIDNGSTVCTQTTTVSPTSFNCSNLGTQTVTLSILNGGGSVASSCQSTVTVVDNLAPVPNVSSLPTITGQCSASVTAPTATDNCAGAVTGTTTSPLSYNQQGTYTITWTYSDGNGNSTTQNQTVIVKDVTAPVPNVANLSTVTAQCSASVTAPTATDNCVGTVTATTTSPLSYSQQGTYTITWTYSDGNGNSTTQNQTVIINDVTAPVPTVSSLPAITSQCSTSLTAPTASDNCAGTITATTTDPLSYSVQGSYTITWTYNDGNGNTTTQTQNVTIADVTAPVVNVANLPVISGQTFAKVTVPPTATDNCAGTVTGTTNDPLSYYNQGSYTITWTYSDGNGNTSTQTQNVLVQDNSSPVPNQLTLATLTGECSVTVPVAPTAADNSGASTVFSSTPASPIAINDYNGGTPGVTTYTINVTGMPTSITAADLDLAITIGGSHKRLGDLTLEIISPLGTQTLFDRPYYPQYTSGAANELSGTYHFQYGTGIPAFPEGQSGVNQPLIPSGYYAPTLDNGVADNWSGFDFSKNPNGNWIFKVSDYKSGSNSTSNLTGFLVSAPTASGASGSLTGTTNDPLYYDQQGTYTITWTYDDGNGNISTQTQTVIVDDITAPVPNTASLSTVSGQCSATVTAPTATDNCAGTITGTTSSPLTYNTQGSYTITWTYDDGNGNTSTQTQTVVVDDITAPVPNTASLATASGECSATVTAPTATDNCAGTVTATTNSPLTYSAQGTYNITWTYDDGNGNTSTQTQTVIVDDNTVPVPDVATLSDVTGECSASVTAPTATDNCAGTITATTNDPLSYNAQGTYTITWTYDDGNGNTSTQTQTVIVDDITAPVTDVASLPNVTGECSATVITTPTATDNCAGTITATTTDALTYNTQGTHTITWTYNDGNGNTSTQTQTVIVDDITAPVADVASLPNVTGECSATVITTPTATDNCAGTITATTGDALTYNTQGTYTITWTYNDGNGNISTQTQTVIVDDITAPVPNVASLPNVTGECSATAIAPKATDNCSGQITATTNDPLTYTNQGTYTITWTYDDGNGNTSTQTQTVIVDDITAPVPNVASLPNVTGECSATAIAPKATDNCSGQITATTNDSLTYIAQGTYTITWKYDDGNGNTSTQTQTVIVDDITAPVIGSIANATGECSVTVTAPVATDNCVGAVTGTTSDPLTYTQQGTYTITWTFNDGNGNTSTKNQTVIVHDITAPVANCKNATVTLVNASASITVANINNNSTDNCGIANITVSPTTFTCANIGANTVTLTVTDIAGNVSTCQATVTVIGAIPNPSISSSVNTVYYGYAPLSTATLTAAGGLTYTWSTASTANPIIVAPTSTTVYTVVAKNAYGCTASASKSIQVVDVRCGNNLDKVSVCHRTGSTTNINQQICIAPAAVAAHLAHGDYLGPCASSRSIAPTHEDAFEVTLYPNPSNGIVNLDMMGITENSPIRVYIIDAMGRMVSQQQYDATYSLDVNYSNLNAGLYHMIVENGSEKRTLNFVINK